MAGDYKKRSNELFARLRQYVTETQILELRWRRIALFIGYGRLGYAFGLEEVGKPCLLSIMQDQEQPAADWLVFQ